MAEEVLATISPSRTRRGMAVALLLALGVTLVYLAFAEAEAGFVLRLVFLTVGSLALALAGRVWRATAVRLILTEAGLHDSAGRVLVRSEDIARVERSAFAFKPSNGFAVRLVRPAETAWVPGLWWRYGRRLGVGGVVSKQEAKMMADIMALRLKLPDLQEQLK